MCCLFPSLRVCMYNLLFPVTVLYILESLKNMIYWRAKDYISSEKCVHVCVCWGQGVYICGNGLIKWGIFSERMQSKLLKPLHTQKKSAGNIAMMIIKVIIATTVLCMHHLQSWKRIELHSVIASIRVGLLQSMICDLWTTTHLFVIYYCVRRKMLFLAFWINVDDYH